MKILLINPPTVNRLRLPKYMDSYLSSIHSFVPPIGLMYIKSYLNRREDADIRLYNFQVPKQPSLNDFKTYLKAFQPDIVGITVISFFWYAVKKTVETIRSVLPGALIVGGGPHMWFYPEESLQCVDFDIIVQGPGEVAFGEIVDHYKEGSDFKNVNGILYRHDGHITKTPPRSIEVDINDLPFPDRSDIDTILYHSPENSHRATALIEASRGCPYNCSFCNNTMRTYKPRRIDLIIQEIMECKKMGYQALSFNDATFTLSRQHATDLCRAMIKNNIDMPWVCRSRVDCIDRETVHWMVKAGCERIEIGVESGNQHILDSINKKITLEQCKKVFKICREEGLITAATYIIGFPGETKEEAQKTISFANDLDADYAACSPLVPLPGTGIFKKAEADPNFDSDWWRRYILNPEPSVEAKIWPTIMTEKEILSFVKKFYYQHYLNPRRIIRYLKHVNGFDDLLIKIKAGIRLISAR